MAQGESESSTEQENVLEEQREEEKQTTVMKELEQEDFTTENTTHSQKETVDDFNNPEDAQDSEQADVPPQEEKEDVESAEEKEADSSQTMKRVDVSCSVQDNVTGTIEGETVELSLDVPANWIQSDTGTMFYHEDGSKAAEGFWATIVPEGQTIWSIAKVDLTPGYVSSQTVTIHGQEVLLSIYSLPWGKGQEPPEDQKKYCYIYLVPYQNMYITTQIYAVGKDNEDAIQLHKEILESISFPTEALTFQTVTFSWENQPNKNLTLQVDVPDNWIAGKDADVSTIDRHFYNQNGLKIAAVLELCIHCRRGNRCDHCKIPQTSLPPF